MSAFDAHLDNYGDPGAGWANEVFEDEEAQEYRDSWEEVNEAERAAFEEQRAFEEWADDQILEDENADWWVARYEPED